MGRFWDTLKLGTRLALCRFAEGGELPRLAGGVVPKGAEISPDDLHKLVHIDEHTRAAAHKLALAELQVGIAKENLFKAIASRLEGEISRTINQVEHDLLARAFLIAFERLLQLLPAPEVRHVTVGYGHNAVCIATPKDGVSVTRVNLADNVNSRTAVVHVQPIGRYFSVFHVVKYERYVTIHIQTSPGSEHPHTAALSVLAQ